MFAARRKAGAARPAFSGNSLNARNGFAFDRLAQDNGFELFRSRFRAAFRRIFETELKRTAGLEGKRLTIAADMVASGVTYAYLDWLAGEYGNLPLEELLQCFEELLDRGRALA